MSFDYGSLVMATVDYLKNTSLPSHTSSQTIGSAIKKIKTQNFYSELNNYQSLLYSTQLKTPFLASPLLLEDSITSSSEEQTPNDYRMFPSEKEPLRTNVPLRDSLKFFQIQKEGSQNKVHLSQKSTLTQNMICFLVEQQRKILRELIINNSQSTQHIKFTKQDPKFDLPIKNSLLTKKPIFKVTRNLVQQKSLKKVVKRDELVKEIRACDIPQGKKTFEFSSFKLNLTIKTKKDGFVKVEA